VRWFRADDEFNNLATSNQHVSFSVADAVYRHNSWPIDDSGYDTIEQLYAAVWPPNSRTDHISTEAKEMVQGLLRTSSTKRLGMIMPRLHHCPSNRSLCPVPFSRSRCPRQAWNSVAATPPYASSPSFAASTGKPCERGALLRRCMLLPLPLCRCRNPRRHKHTRSPQSRSDVSCSTLQRFPTLPAARLNTRRTP
jgi:hypothetical protein